MLFARCTYDEIALKLIATRFYIIRIVLQSYMSVLIEC